MEFVFATGGRENYFKAERVRDCVCRAIANATGVDYLEVYNGLNELAKKERKSSRKRGTSNARNGVFTATAKKYIEDVLGWKWHPCMTIGSGCQTHLRASELPKTGSYILNLSKHFTCWKDGKLYDTYDCSRFGDRCVYGYWYKPTPEELEEFRETKKLMEQNKKLEEEHLAQTKKKVQKVKDSYQKKIHKLELQINKLKRHMAKEIETIKKADAQEFIDKLLN